MAIMAKKERAFGEKCVGRAIHSPRTRTHLPSALHSSILYIYIFIEFYILSYIYIYIYTYKIIKFDKERPTLHQRTHVRAYITFALIFCRVVHSMRKLQNLCLKTHACNIRDVENRD